MEEVSNSKSKNERVIAQNLDYIFHPKSIAIVGASSNPASKGYDYLNGILEFEFDGKLYPINPKESKISGVKCYFNIRDIPESETVDYVISCIPARPSIQLIQDCAAKGAKVLQLYTAGFGEMGEVEGIKLEERLLRKARKFDIRVIGPNCMGIHYPKGGLAFARAKFSQKSGPVGCLVQSGGHAWNLVSSGSLRGICFSKVISFGNACDLDETDFLEYLAEDDETKIIAAYIEGVKDALRFKQAVKKATQAKPVIIFKGGKTEAGKRAVSSHTGALAGNVRIWDAQGFMETINLVASEPEIDLLLVHIVIELAGQWKGRSVLEGITKALFTSYKTITKPMAVVLHSFGTPPGLHMLHDIRKK